METAGKKDGEKRGEKKKKSGEVENQLKTNIKMNKINHWNENRHDRNIEIVIATFTQVKHTHKMKHTIKRGFQWNLVYSKLNLHFKRENDSISIFIQNCFDSFFFYFIFNSILNWLLDTNGIETECRGHNLYSMKYGISINL